MKFGHLILMKIIKLVATRCQILRLSAPNSISAGGPTQTQLGELTALPKTAQLDLKGLLLREGKGWGIWGEMEGDERKGREEKVRDPQGLVDTPMSKILKNSLSHHCICHHYRYIWCETLMTLNLGCKLQTIYLNEICTLRWLWPRNGYAIYPLTFLLQLDCYTHLMLTWYTKHHKTNHSKSLSKNMLWC